VFLLEYPHFLCGYPNDVESISVEVLIIEQKYPHQHVPCDKDTCGDTDIRDVTDVRTGIRSNVERTVWGGAVRGVVFVRVPHKPSIVHVRGCGSW